MKKLLLIGLSSLLILISLNLVSASLCKGNDYYYDCYQNGYNYPNLYSYKWHGGYSYYDNYRDSKYNFYDPKFTYYKDQIRESFHKGYEKGYKHGFYDGYKIGYDKGHEIGYKHGYDDGHNDAKEKYKDKTKTSYYKNI